MCSSDLLTPYREGRCPLVVEYHNSKAKVELSFGDAWRIRPDEQLLDSLRQLIGNENVEIVYR